MKTKIALLSLVVSCLTTTLYSQSSERPWNIGIYGGKSEYNGDLGTNFFRPDLAYYGFVGASASRYINRFFDVTLYGSYGEHGMFESNTSHFLSRNTYGDLTLKLKLNPKERAKFIPYIFAGIGGRNLDSYNVDPGLDLVIPAGIGADLQLTRVISLRYFSTLGYSNHDFRDLEAHGSYNDAQLQHNLGIAFNFGRKKDDDKDGISNRKDKCPGTTEGALVDKQGCILDADKDGIADNLDNCPNVFGIASFKGCPDTDGDGIQDSEDACPKIAGIKDFNGCPDTDKDGIEDSKDKCPEVKGIALFDGCPDSDNDGIQDTEDACPNKKGLAAFKGCPDTDNDGVQDSEDKCPNQAGIVSNNGCPEIKITEKAKQIFQKAMTGIQFETGKDIIKKSSAVSLDNVVSVLKENPDWNVEVQGHTDNVGNYDSNKTLSEKRALAVKKYLESKGVTNKMISNGYGSDKPISDNKSPKGRALNRRVEFNITYLQ